MARPGRTAVSAKTSDVKTESRGHRIRDSGLRGSISLILSATVDTPCYSAEGVYSRWSTSVWAFNAPE